MPSSNNLKIAVVAHFMSQNMGDRYQGSGVLRHLVGNSTLSQFSQIDCINVFAGMDRDPNIWLDVPQAGGRAVINIRAVDLRDYDFIIMPTGSISSETAFVALGQCALASDRLKRLYIWGGFANPTDRYRVFDDEIERLRPLFKDHRVTFLARSWHDFAAYSMIATQDRGRVAGDPILLNQPICCRPDRIAVPQSEVPMIWNGNIESYDTGPMFEKLKGMTSRHISIDPDRDRVLASMIGDNLEILRDLNLFRPKSAEWRGVVTSRLHGGIMAKCFNAQCPVLFIACDLPAPFSTSFKYHASALSSYAPFAPIGFVEPAHNIDYIRRFFREPEAFFSYEHEHNFLQYALITERTIGTIVEELLEHMAILES